MDFQNILRQAAQLKERMQKIQEELGGRTVEATAGGGMVTAVANGRQEIVEIRIEKEVLRPEEAELLQDMIRGAVNSALSRSREMASQEMAKLTGGLGIPGLF